MLDAIQNARFFNAAALQWGNRGWSLRNTKSSESDEKVATGFNVRT